MISISSFASLLFSFQRIFTSTSHCGLEGGRAKIILPNFIEETGDSERPRKLPTSHSQEVAELGLELRVLAMSPEKFLASDYSWPQL